MRNRGTKEIALVAGGIILGAAIASPVAGAALMAQQSSQRFVVDGKSVQIEAYAIGGSNYVKLRDVGRAMNFSVDYDPLTNTVRIDSAAPYDNSPSALTTGGTVKLPNDGSQYVPRPGDRILCDDGTEYEITSVVHACPNVRYYVDAYDYYHNHVYQYTRYCLMSI